MKSKPWSKKELCTQKKIDRLTSVISAMEQKQIQRAEIHLSAWHMSVQGTFGRCGDERGSAEIVGERLRFFIHDSETHERKKRGEHQPPREQHLQPKSDTTGSDCSSGLCQNIILETGFPCASLKFKQQEWPDLGLEDVDRQGVGPKAAEHHALEICRKMTDKVRQKAAVKEKKKDDDLKKKKEVSKKNRGRRAWKSFGLSRKKGHQGRAK